MKTRTEVTVQKLRGGFYTPDPLVDLTLARLHANLDARSSVRMLEPAAGDGAFLRGVERSAFRRRLELVTAVELIDREAAQCRQVATDLRLPAEVVNADFLSWQHAEDGEYDAAVGNPPFVRFQFIDDGSKAAARRLAEELGLPPRGVSNLWIPVLLGALARLRPGGAFAFVIPAECFTGVSAGSARQWLVRECERLTFDIFPPASFPGVLQEVMILSGIRSPSVRSRRKINVVEHIPGEPSWSHSVEADGTTWTRYLLRPADLEALAGAQALANVKPLGSIAKFEVAAVTGANAYFSVDEATMNEYHLSEWTVPLLPRLRLAKGLTYSIDDHAEVVRSGSKSALLDFSENRPDPQIHEGAAEYIRVGESKGLDRRYKTRIRRPWYRVPLIRSESLLLSKRAHHYHRVVLNLADAVTTDTIYRGWLTSSVVTEADFVASFHNSMTLLTAELEGRSFGGGVLELVPSEIGRLSVPTLSGFGSELDRFDRLARSNGHTGNGTNAELVNETNAFLVKADIGLTSELLHTLEDARQHLAGRRLDRNSSDRT